MTAMEPGQAGSQTLARLFDITQDILQAQEIGTALFSIARGLSELFSFKCVSIVASDVPGGDLSRRVLLGFSEETVRERLGEHVARADILKLLSPDFEVVRSAFIFLRRATRAGNTGFSSTICHAMLSVPTLRVGTNATHWPWSWPIAKDRCSDTFPSIVPTTVAFQRTKRSGRCSCSLIWWVSH
ncbi:MAG: hypothetical protein M3Y18_09520 [Candidatus Eremiobacteraeota bacterium]|nr:hypothetical protein [Candidatus Eremiobacteraeota bacterium]